MINRRRTKGEREWAREGKHTGDKNNTYKEEPHAVAYSASREEFLQFYLLIRKSCWAALRSP